MLTEVNRLSDAMLPLEACKAHLRLGHGFADDGGQDGLIGRYLRAAILAVEARIGKALLQRTFRLRRADWRNPDGEVLPIAPVASILSVSIQASNGETQIIDPAQYRLEQDLHSPRLRPAGWMLPQPPIRGQVEVTFVAGFGTDWHDVPDDLAQAVMMLVAQYHESRQGAAGAGRIPFGVMPLIERWRVVRTSAGGRR